MTLVSLTPHSFASNCYLAIQGNHAYIVDPSASVERIMAALQENHATCDGILLTHAHFDHMLSLDPLADALPNVPVYVHADDAENLTDGEKNAYTAFFGRPHAYRRADKLLHEGDRLPLGDAYLTVLHTPGHTKGSVCYLGSENDYLLSGDTLFAQGYGRYDLYGGDATALMASLRRLATLPGELILASGHGELSTLADAVRMLES